MNGTIRYFVFIVFCLLLVSSAPNATGQEHGVFKSLDNGQSWDRADIGIPKTTRTNAFGSSGNVLFAGTDSGLYFSNNRSQMWKPATGLAANSGRIISIATSGSNVFLGTDGNGLLKSADAGTTWVRNESLPIKKVRCLLSEDDKLYAGTETQGVFVSDDEGVTWRNLSGGMPANSQVFDLAQVKGKLFAGLYSKGLYTWNSDGSSWKKAGDVLPLVLASSSGILIAGHNPGELFWSDDLGGSWFKGIGKPVGLELLADLPSEAAVWEVGANETLAIAGASDGIYLSEDHGRNWMRASKGLPHSPGIAFLVTPRLVLAATTLKKSER